MGFQFVRVGAAKAKPMFIQVAVFNARRINVEMGNTSEIHAPAMSRQASADSQSSDSASAPQQNQGRLERVDDYEAAGTAKPDPLDACIAIVNADLIRIAIEYGRTIRESLSHEATGESFRRRELNLNNYLRLTRQIDRFAHLDQKADAKNSAK